MQVIVIDKAMINCKINIFSDTSHVIYNISSLYRFYLTLFAGII